MISSTDDPSACSRTAPGSCHSMIRFRVCTALFFSCLIACKASSENFRSNALLRGIGPGQTKASRFLLTNSSTVIGWRAAYIGDITIGTGKNAVSVIDRNLLQMRPFIVIPVHSAPIRESRLSSGLDSLQPGSRANGRNGRGPAVDQEV